jgi:ABC-type xylose transport system permease subunit
MNDGTVGLYGNGFDVKVCAAIVVGAAVLYGGIEKCVTDVCGGIALDVDSPCG